MHAQTLALYRLLDELRARHPGLEVESCSSGGARIDLGVLERTDRVWVSDCIDALERQSIQRWTALLLPPELMGTHVGAPRSLTTGRVHDLSFRAGTALFGHLGIEWDISAATAEDRAELARWVGLYKEVRALLHSGTVVRADHPDGDAFRVHGVVSPDAGDALFALVSIGTPVCSAPGRVLLPGLDPQARYTVRALTPGHTPRHNWWAPPPWLTASQVSATGRMLANSGLQAPSLHPDQLLLLRVTRQGARPGGPGAGGRAEGGT